jgi:FkbM family methyltransferase
MGHKVWPPNGTLSQWVLDQFPLGYQGWGLDIGASDGISINTTYALEKSHRWNIVCVEPNPEFRPSLRKYRAMSEFCAVDSEPSESATLHVNTVNPEAFSALRPTVREDLYPSDGLRWIKVQVEVKTVDQILERWQFPRLDLLAVDTEGTELDILKGLDIRRWRPKVIVTECWDASGPIDPYLESFGYKKTARNVHNDIFIRKD